MLDNLIYIYTLRISRCRLGAHYTAVLPTFRDSIMQRIILKQ